MTDEPIETSRPRQELLRRRAMRNGWLCVAIGLIVPFLALGGAWVGWSARHVDRRGVLLAVTGVGVFVVRLALWMNGIP